MAEPRKNFTIIWKIKNFSFGVDQILSPVFTVHEMSETKWKFLLNCNSQRHKDCAACYLQRDINDSCPERLELDHELSFLDGYGFVIKSEIFLKEAYGKGQYKEALHAQRDEICLKKKDLFIPDNILTIRCRMWNNQESITQLRTCIAETCIETESINFVGMIKKFSNTALNCKNLVCIQSSSTVAFLSSMSLCVTTDDKLVIEIKLVNWEPLCIYSYKIFIRDIFGHKIKSGDGEFRGNNLHAINLTLLKTYLMDNKRYYLPKDVLIIECEVTFSTRKLTEKIDYPDLGFDFQDTQGMVSNAMKTNLSSNEYQTDNFTTLKDDFNSLFTDSVLCDTKLKTATETFPAHIAVLSARSPVFKSMFTSEMKEKTNKCVDIHDLDADTVRQMLLFMYCDALKDLNYASARSLYFAADKYNIVSLKHRSSYFLKNDLLVSNCCDVLLLADKHQDEDLKHAVLDYIMQNDETVLFSEEWKNLEKNNSQLTTEVLRYIYMKSRNM